MFARFHCEADIPYVRRALSSNSHQNGHGGGGFRFRRRSDTPRKNKDQHSTYTRQLADSSDLEQTYHGESSSLVIHSLLFCYIVYAHRY
jgi:hypothetical protein